MLLGRFVAGAVIPIIRLVNPLCCPTIPRRWATVQGADLLGGDMTATGIAPENLQEGFGGKKSDAMATNAPRETTDA